MSDEEKGGSLAKTLSDPNAFYRFENWYKLIEDLTFTSKTIPLSFEQAQSLKKYREDYILFKQYKRLVEKENVNNNNNYTESKFKPKSDEVIESLKLKLDEVIQGQDSFIKLSTRSPKDSALSSEKIKDFIRKEMENTKKPKNQFEERIQDLLFFVRAGIFALKVKSGQEALDLILNSQRIFEDLTRLDLYTESEEKWELSFIIRKWVDIAPEWEMRCFIFNGKMTTVSQYYNIAFVPELYEKRHEIKDYILNFFEFVVKKRVSVLDYTLDLALDPNLKKDPWVVEINHSPPTAGTALFDWDNPKDRDLIQNGPFTLRILEPPKEKGEENSIFSKPLKEIIFPPVAFHLDLLRKRTIKIEDLNLINCDFCHKNNISLKKGNVWKRCIECAKDVCENCQKSKHSCQENWCAIEQDNNSNQNRNNDKENKKKETEIRKRKGKQEKEDSICLLY